VYVPPLEAKKVKHLLLVPKYRTTFKWWEKNLPLVLVNDG